MYLPFFIRLYISYRKCSPVPDSTLRLLLFCSTSCLPVLDNKALADSALSLNAHLYCVQSTITQPVWRLFVQLQPVSCQWTTSNKSCSDVKCYSPVGSSRTAPVMCGAEPRRRQRTVRHNKSVCELVSIVCTSYLKVEMTSVLATDERLLIQRF